MLILHLLALIHAVSPLGAVAGSAGLVLIGLLVFGLLSGPIARWAALAGAVLLVAAAVYGTGYARATFAEQARRAEAAAHAELLARAAAERIAGEQSALAERHRADLAAATRRLEELKRHVESRPDRDRACVDRDTARRLRAL